MLLGRQYELDTATVAIDANRVAVKIPAGSLVRTISEVNANDLMVDVQWEGRPYTMFVRDLKDRGKPVDELDRGNTVNEPTDSGIPYYRPYAEGLSQTL